MKIGQHESHPAADVFPMFSPDALASMADGIRTSGLLHPIVLHAGKILDGRNRYAACLLAKVEPVFVEYQGSDTAEAIARYVYAENLDRRDLAMDQRALCLRRLVALAKVQRIRRRVQAALPGVATVDQQMADSLLADGCPELVAAVDAGLVDLALAATAARTLEPDDQRALVAKASRPEPVKPVRAVQDTTTLASVAVTLTPVDVERLRSLVRQAEKSVHADIRHAAALVRRMAPVVGR